MKASQLTGDSTVRDVRFVNSTASLLYEDYESDRTYRLSVDTCNVYSEASHESDSVHIEFRDLRAILLVDPASGRYMLPAEFGKQMAVHRKLGHLAVGLKASSFPLMLVVRGYKVLLATPINSEDHVTLTEVPEDGLPSKPRTCG